MLEYKIIFGYLAIILQVASYAVYFWGIWKGETKPHAFTWFVGGVINLIAFPAVLISGGGIGSIVLGGNIVGCFITSIIGWRQKSVQYDLYDWLALLGGLLGAFLWWLTDNPLSAVILVSISDIISYIPTFRKAYRLPFEENATAFLIGFINYPIAILALESLTLTTWLYMATIALVDISLVVLILFRRKNTKVS